MPKTITTDLKKTTTEPLVVFLEQKIETFKGMVDISQFKEK
jgi:hypothetical protein